MKFLWVLGFLLLPLAARGQTPAIANVVTVCGTPNSTYSVGQNAPVTQDTTGKVCGSGGGGGGSTSITPGTTTILGATAPCFIENSTGTTMACPATIPNASVAAAPLPTPGSGATLVAPRSYYVCTTTCTVTLPTPAAGYEFCVRNDNNVSTVITFAAIASVQFENTNFTSYKTANTSIASGGAAGDKLCVLGRDATHYLVMSFVGTWS